MSSNFPKPARRRNSGPATQTPHRTGPSDRPDRPDRPGSHPGQGRQEQEDRKGGRPAPALHLEAGAADADVEHAPLLPGIKPVLELLLATPDKVDAVFLRKGRHGKDMERIVDTCRRFGVRFSLLDSAAFARVYAGNSQGVIARLFEAGYSELDELLDNVMESPLPLLLALDQVQDPGNAGTLARTLYAMGGAGIITPRHNGVFLGGAASKAAAGSLERMPVSKVANLGQALDKAKKAGITIYGAAAAPVAKVAQPGQSGQPGQPGQPGQTAQPGQPGQSGQTGASPSMPVLPVLDIYTAQFRLPAILLLGSEEHGIRPGLEKRCDFLLSIPMLRDFDSLNVAQAGGIIISAMARARLLATR